MRFPREASPTAVGVTGDRFEGMAIAFTATAVGEGRSVVASPKMPY